MATYITKRRQSLSCSARSFNDTLAMKKSSALKLRRQNSCSQFRWTTRDWSHSCTSPQTKMAPTHACINFFSFWLNNLHTEIKSEIAIYQVLLMLKSTVLTNEALFYYCRAMQFLSFEIIQQLHVTFGKSRNVA